MNIPFYKSSPVYMAIMAITILTVAGCGGDGSAGGAAAVPLSDDFGNTPFTAHQMFPDNGAIAGAINFAASQNFPDGDVDWFKFPASEGIAYVLQFRGFPAELPDASDPVFIDLRVFESDAITRISLTVDATLPANFVNLVDDRIMFTGQSTGTHYIRIAHNRPLVGTGNYAFNLASSQIGEVSIPELAFTQDYTVLSNLQTKDDDDVLLLDRTVSGFLEVIRLNPDTREIRIRFGTEAVAFLDAMGDPSETEETSEVHIHLGFPDNFDTPNDPSLDFNLTPSIEDHAKLLTITSIFPGGRSVDLTQVIPEDIFRVMVGKDWYADLHFTGDTDKEPRPILSTRANGTLTFFQSELLMIGANVVPPVNTTLSLELLYNSAYQRFMIGYEVGADPSSSLPTGPLPNQALVDGAMHVHRGTPGTNGPILIDLGVLPLPFDLPQFESLPFIKNVVKTLSNTEVAILRNAYYNTGFYVDLHDPADPDITLLRAEGFLEFQTNPGAFATGPN